MSEPRICIIGAGGLSSRRIYPYIGTAGGQLVGVCDINSERAQKNAKLFGGKAYSDYNEMLKAENPDGVIVCIGPAYHAIIAKDIMKKGIPVYTEKPCAISASEALEVARVSKETSILCTTAFKKRYNTAYNKAKKWIDTFNPSDLYSISIDYASAKYSNDSETSSLLLDFAIHIIDLTLYLFGDVEKVFCFSKSMDAYAVSLKFVNGAVGSLNLNDGRSFQVPTEEVEISIANGNFMTVHNSSCWKISENQKPIEWHEPDTFTSNGDSGYNTGHLPEIIDFFEAIQERRTTRSNIYESYKSMVLYEAIKKSAETEAVVDIKYDKI